MNDPHIRVAGSQDLIAIKAIIDSTGLFPSEMLDEMFSEGQDCDPEFWLTYDNGQPQAVAYCVPEAMANGVANLLLIAVHKQSQSTGIGQRLMTYIEEKLKKQNVRILLVETSGNDEFARTRLFYEKLGYTNEAQIKDYYDTGDDKIIFTKTL